MGAGGGSCTCTSTLRLGSLAVLMTSRMWARKMPHKSCEKHSWPTQPPGRQLCLTGEGQTGMAELSTWTL